MYILYKTSLLHQPNDYIGFTPSCPPHILQQNCAHAPPTNSKYRVKSFCEVVYTNFRPNVFGAGKRISMEILVGVGLHG